jgi:DNA transposition AAA+ family ATPase
MMIIDEQQEKNTKKQRRFKALVLYSEERGVGKTCLAKSFVYNNQNWIIQCRNKFNADQFKLREEAKLLLIDDFGQF